MSVSDSAAEQQHQTEAEERVDVTESNIQALEHNLSRKIKKHESSNLPKRESSILPRGLRTFTYKEIKVATEGFARSTKIGQGGFGSVYKGTLTDNTEVAIKVLDAQSDGGSDEYVKELPMVQDDNIKTFLEEIFDYISDNSTRSEIVGIWGPAGIGKTTILRHIYKSFANSMFDCVLFVMASRECTTQKIQNNIVQQLKLNEEDDIEAQARTIFDYLCNKKFLLLLDDVWEYVNMDDIGLPTSRKVVFTTRSETVCGDMQANRRIKVGLLNHEDAWNLFKKTVGEPILNDPIIRVLAEEVIAGCGGLPLALVTIGKVMSGKRNRKEWMNVIGRLSNNHSLPSPDNNLFSQLRISFDSLKEDRERECFLCCALWPEDFSIHKEELITCWMGHGLLDDSFNIYLEGYTIIGNLLDSCLLELDEEDAYVKMRDIVRDMALWIVSQRGDKWVVRAGLGSIEVPNLKSYDWHVTQRISLAYNKIRSLPSWHDMDFKKLNTLMLQSNRLLISTNLPSWTYYSELKYLDLSSNMYHSRSPVSIFSLDVFECMKNLEYLNLSDLRLTIHFDELPHFSNLKYLLLKNNIVIAQRPPSIPPKLLVLDVYKFYGIAEHGMIIDGLYHHNQVNHNKWLSLLGVHVQSVEELRRASILNVRSVAIHGMEGHSSLDLADPDVLGNNYCKYGLNELCISRCHDGFVELLVSGSPPTTLANLRSLKLLGLSSVERIIFRGLAPADFFPRLREITIVNCSELSHASWVLLLPCLEKLKLLICDKMEYVIIGSQVKTEDRERNAFPRLKELTLFSMPALVGVCDDALSVPPLLEDFSVFGDCSKLRKFPFKVPTSTSTLQRINGQQQWWDDLIWDDDEYSRAYFLQYFHSWPFPDNTTSNVMCGFPSVDDD